MTRVIDILIYDEVNLLDVAGPAQAFEAASGEVPAAYALRYVSPSGRPVRASSGLRLTAEAKLSPDDLDHDLLVPGGSGVDALMADGRLMATLATRAAGPARIISVCSGAMALAKAGVLDGLTATTHWARQDQTKAYPNVDWDLDKISIAQGKVFTSAGVTTGIDLALSLIQSDLGPSVALAVARELVVQLRRTGGQSQYAFHLAGQFTGDDTLATLIEKIVTEPQRDWTLEPMAAAVGMNARTLTRRFKRELGETPAQYVEKIRVDHARTLLQEGLPLKRVATESGFGDLQRMRRAFQRRFGVQLSDYRAMFA